MASIQKTDKGTYKVQYRDPTGKQRYRAFAKRAEAKEFLSTVDNDVRKGAWTDPKLGRMLFGQWVEQWWPTTLDLRPSTRSRDAQYLDSYVVPQFGDIPLTKITPLEIRDWVASLDEEGLAPATTKKAYQIFAKAIRSAVEAGLLPQTPCRGISLPKIETVEMRFLPPGDVELLADAIGPRYRALVLVAAYGGMRWAELIGLRSRRVDLLRGMIDVSEIMVEVDGKFLAPGPPKTKAGRRKVLLPRSVAKELAIHINSYCDQSSDLVFQTAKGNPIHRSTFRNRFWLPALGKADIEPLRFHDLRHTAVSLWIAAGAHAREIAMRAGHTSAAVVLDRYGHIFPEADQRLTEALETMFQGARAQIRSRRPADITPIESRRTVQELDNDGE